MRQPPTGTTEACARLHKLMLSKAAAPREPLYLYERVLADARSADDVPSAAPDSFSVQHHTTRRSSMGESPVETVEGEILDEGEVVSQEIERYEPVEQRDMSLFHTTDPVEVIEKATKVANALKGVLVGQQLTKRISGRDHVLVEGWTTLGSMLGIVPVLAWSRRVEPKTEYEVKFQEFNWPFEDGRKQKRLAKEGTYTVEGYDWEARVEARTFDQRVIGAAEALVSRAEKSWAQRDDYALKSMAQTRATSKAMRGPLGFVVALAGYNPTPADEMSFESQHQETAPPPPPYGLKASDRELAGLEKALLSMLDDPDYAGTVAAELKARFGYTPQAAAWGVMIAAAKQTPDDETTPKESEK